MVCFKFLFFFYSFILQKIHFLVFSVIIIKKSIEILSDNLFSFILLFVLRRHLKLRQSRRIRKNIANPQHFSTFPPFDWFRAIIICSATYRIQHEELTSVPDFEDATTFTIESVTDAYDQAEVATFGGQFQETVGIGIAANTYPIILGVGQAVKVTVVFAPQDAEREHQSVLMVRNNLTGLETIDLVGKGATGDLKFGNRRTGTTFSHAFDVTENHLKDCDKERSASQPNLTVKRHFTARNTGQVPIWVTGFEIDGYACEGYGFKVLDCEPFELAPNQHRRINIAFTPDFTLSHITRTLTMKTSLSTIPGRGDVTYALVATVPAHLLAVCAGSLPRPRWEGYLYILMISLMVVSLLCVLVAAVMESDRLLHFTYITCDQVAFYSIITYFESRFGSLKQY